MTYSGIIDFYLLGHRGARAEILENSEIGFVHAHALRPALNGVEFDVQLTADNQLVVVHDADLQRLTQSQRTIYQSTLAELQALLQSDDDRFINTKNPDFLNQPILTLKNLLPYLADFEHIELEVKTHNASDYQALAKAVFEVLNNENWQAINITITSFDTDFLVAWQNFNQDLGRIQYAPTTLNFYKKSFKTGLLLESHTSLASEIAFFPTTLGEIYEVCNLACRLGCSQIGAYFALITPELVQIAKRFGLGVTAWTVNDVKIAKKLLDWGVTTIITDFPTEFCDELK